MKEDLTEKAYKLLRDNNLNGVKDFVSKYQNHTAIYYFKNLLFAEACRFGNLEMAQWLHSIGMDVSYKKSEFNYACQNGHLEVAQWLYSSKPYIYLLEDFNKAFIYSCMYGYYDVAEWLYSLKPDIKINFEEYSLHGNICQRGYLDIAKLVFKVKPELFTRQFNYGFRVACGNGHVEFAKWLLTVCTDRDLGSFDCVFEKTCKKGYLEISQILCSLNPKYTIVIQDNKIVSYNIFKFCINSSLKIQLKSIDLENKTCPICYETQVNIQTNCKHNFCKDCISKYCELNNCYCPYCRIRLTDFYLIQ